MIIWLIDSNCFEPRTGLVCASATIRTEGNHMTAANPFPGAITETEVIEGVSFFTFNPNPELYHSWLGYGTFTSSWATMELPVSHKHGYVVRRPQKFVLAESMSIHGLSLVGEQRRTFSENIRDTGVFPGDIWKRELLLSDLGIVPRPNGEWKEGVFSVRATLENLARIADHVQPCGLSLAERIREILEWEQHRDSEHSRFFMDLAMSYLQAP